MNENGLFYIVSFIAAVLAGLSQHAHKKKNVSNILLFSSFLTLLIYLGFRNYGIGIDDYTYNRIFNEVSSIGVIKYFLYSTMEPGYLLLNSAVGVVSSNFQSMIFVTSFIILANFFRTFNYYKDKIDLFLAVLLYCTLVMPYNFGIIRLSIAFSFTFYGMRFFFEKNRKMFNLYIFIASMFHYSAFILLLLNLLFSIDFEKSKNIKILYLIMLFLFPVVFFFVARFIVPILGSRYSTYVFGGKISFDLGSFDKLPIILLCIMFYKSIKISDSNAKMYIILYSFTIFFSIYSTMINFGRVQWYFSILLCLIFPMLKNGISKGKEKKWNFIIVPLIIIYCFIYSGRLLVPGAKNVIIENYDNIIINNVRKWE